MGKIYGSALELIGNTPLVEVKNVEKSEGLELQYLPSLSILTRQEALRTESVRQ